MMFASLDFETANRSRVSICAAGIAIFEDGNLAESLHWLVRPPKGHGWFLPEFTEDFHGLTWFDVQNAPEFPAIAPALLERLTRADIVIAHNAPSPSSPHPGPPSNASQPRSGTGECRCNPSLEFIQFLGQKPGFAEPPDDLPVPRIRAFHMVSEPPGSL